MVVFWEGIPDVYGSKKEQVASCKGAKNLEASEDLHWYHQTFAVILKSVLIPLEHQEHQVDLMTWAVTSKCEAKTCNIWQRRPLVANGFTAKHALALATQQNNPPHVQ